MCLDQVYYLARTLHDLYFKEFCMSQIGPIKRRENLLMSDDQMDGWKDGWKDGWAFRSLQDIHKSGGSNDIYISEE